MLKSSVFPVSSNCLRYCRVISTTFLLAVNMNLNIAWQAISFVQGVASEPFSEELPYQSFKYTAYAYTPSKLYQDS